MFKQPISYFCILFFKMALLKTIIIIGLVYFGLKFLFRILAPYFLKYLAKKIAKRFGVDASHMFNAQDNSSVKKPPSKNKPPSRKINSKEDDGDYIDYEEID